MREKTGCGRISIYYLFDILYWLFLFKNDGTLLSASHATEKIRSINRKTQNSTTTRDYKVHITFRFSRRMWKLPQTFSSLPNSVFWGTACISYDRFDLFFSFFLFLFFLPMLTFQPWGYINHWGPRSLSRKKKPLNEYALLISMVMLL